MSEHLQCSSCGHTSHCGCEGCLDLSVSCKKAFRTCPCWEVSKCIQVCKLDNANSPTSKDCAKDCDSDSEPCNPPTVPGSEAKCCHRAKACVDPTDDLDVNYSVKFNKFGDNVIYSANLRICNDDDAKCGCIKVDKIVFAVEELVGGVWELVPGSVQSVQSHERLEPGCCIEYILAGAIPGDRFNPNAQYRVIVRVKHGKKSDCIVFPFPRCVSECDDDTTWILTDDGFSQEITEDGSVCIDLSYPASDPRRTCPATIENTATITPNPPPIDDCDDMTSTSNTTKLKIECPEYNLDVHSTINCLVSDQWCICKSATVSTVPPARRVCYQLNVTNVGSTQSCQLKAGFTFAASCLSYEKDYTYTITYGPAGQSGVQLCTGSFSLGPGPNNLSYTINPDCTLCVEHPEAGSANVVTVTITAKTGTYNLSECTYTHDAGDTFVHIASELVNPIVTECGSIIVIKDSFEGLSSNQYTVVPASPPNPAIDQIVADILSQNGYIYTPASGPAPFSVAFCIAVTDPAVTSVRNVAQVCVSSDCIENQTVCSTSTVLVYLPCAPVVALALATSKPQRQIQPMSSSVKRTMPIMRGIESPRLGQNTASMATVPTTQRSGQFGQMGGRRSGGVVERKYGKK